MNFLFGNDSGNSMLPLITHSINTFRKLENTPADNNFFFRFSLNGKIQPFKNCKKNSIIMYIEIHWKAICNIIIFKLTYLLFKLILIKISNGEKPE